MRAPLAKVAVSSLQDASPIPPAGLSRWAQLKHLIPVSRETWRQLVITGRAPAPVRLSARCSLYANAQIYKWLADPANYRHEQDGAQ